MCSNKWANAQDALDKLQEQQFYCKAPWRVIAKGKESWFLGFLSTLSGKTFKIIVS